MYLPIDNLALLDNVTNGDFVTNTTFVTALVGLLAVFVTVIAMISNTTKEGFQEAKIERKESFDKVDTQFNKVDTQFDKADSRFQDLEKEMVEIKTLLKLNLLREGIDFATQEQAVAEATAKLEAKQNKNQE